MASRLTARRELLVAARALGVVIGLGLVAVAPARWQLAGLEARDALEHLARLGSGLLVDVSVLALLAAMFASALLLVARRSLARAALATSGVLLWLAVVSVLESRLSRGLFPSWVDVRLMIRSPALMRGSVDMFMAERNLVPAACLLPLAAVLVLSFPPPSSHRFRPAGYALGLGVSLWLWSSALVALAEGPAVAQSTPLGLATIGELREAAACAGGPCEPAALLDEHDEAEAPLAAAALEDRGAAELGWPPFVRDRAGVRRAGRAFPSAELAATERARAAPLVDLLAALSDELFTDSTEPVHLWQVVLEGVRGDDLHALNPGAPPALAPQLDALYAAADEQESGVLAGRQLWSAGVRTPHGLAALVCGLGTLPYGLTLSRDLPELALRCLPDLLAEAGYALGFGYGGAPELDRVGALLATHAIAPWVTSATLDAAQPRTAWGATDRALFAAASEAPLGSRSSYALLLTLSHHHPYVAPPDLSSEVRARALAAFALADARAGSADRDRLITLSYTDDALGEWLAMLERRTPAGRHIVVITSDHAVPERMLWHHRPGAASAHRTRAVLPLVVWISPTLLEGARDPARAAELRRQAARELRHTLLSQNDLPTLLLALLEHAPDLRELPTARRWHTMGGQSTSPWFRPAGPRGTAIHGIHAGTALYFVDEQGEPSGPDEPAPLVVSRDRARSVTPSLRAAARALARARADATLGPPGGR